MDGTGTIIQVQDFSVHDGDGIRTTIFFAGCPLRCRWCANPESWTLTPKLAFFREKCVDCGLCAQICPQGLLRGQRPGAGKEPEAKAETETYRVAGGRLQDRGQTETPLCTVCGLCADRCPQGALSVMGRVVTVSQIVRQVERDSLFYGPSGGGVTFSGGEATVQSGFLRELTEALYDRGVGMWLETCGFFSFDEVKDILLKLDHIFFDLKHMDPLVHREMTGMENGKILDNCRRVHALGVPLTLRIPAIPEVNLTEDNLRRAVDFTLDAAPDAELELLPYHAYGVPKYRALRLGEAAEFEIPSAETMERAERFFESRGVKVVRYR